MSDHDNETARPPADPRRKLFVAGIAGLAVVAGGGSYLLMSRDTGTETRDTNAVAPLLVPTPDSSDTATSAAEPSVARSPVPSGTAAPTTSAPASRSKAMSKPKQTDAASVRKEIDAARKKAEREGYPLQRPLAEPPIRLQQAGSLSEQTQTLPDGGTMRIISAKYDLSSQREMLWAADGGEPVDGSRCTQNFRFAQNAKPAVRQNMLLCWHNSDKRSVVVLSLGKGGSPSKKAAVEAIEQEWDKLG